MRPAWEEEYGKLRGACNVNLGCALAKEPGFVNLDMNPASSPDVVWNLETGKVPFPDSSVDLFLASHVMEHVRNIFELMADLWRALKPGGHLVAVVPHGSNSVAWDCPLHVRRFTQNTWAYFCSNLYETELGGIRFCHDQGFPIRDWQIVTQTLVPFAEFADDPELEWKIAHLNNVINEVHVVMRAIKGGQ